VLEVVTDVVVLLEVVVLVELPEAIARALKAARVFGEPGATLMAITIPFWQWLTGLVCPQ